MAAAAAAHLFANAFTRLTHGLLNNFNNLLVNYLFSQLDLFWFDGTLVASVRFHTRFHLVVSVAIQSFGAPIAETETIKHCGSVSKFNEGKKENKFWFAATISPGCTVTRSKMSGECWRQETKQTISYFIHVAHDAHTLAPKKVKKEQRKIDSNTWSWRVYSSFHKQFIFLICLCIIRLRLVVDFKSSECYF